MYWLWSDTQLVQRLGSIHGIGYPISTGSCLPCGDIEQVTDCLNLLCSLQEWHPSRLIATIHIQWFWPPHMLVSPVKKPSMALGPQLARVYFYPMVMESIFMVIFEVVVILQCTCAGPGSKQTEHHQLAHVTEQAVHATKKGSIIQQKL